MEDKMITDMVEALKKYDCAPCSQRLNAAERFTVMLRAALPHLKIYDREDMYEQDLDIREE